MTLMTLAKARAEMNRAFKEARIEVMAGRRSARMAAEGLIAVFWQFNPRFKSRKDRSLFLAWFVKKHEALGKELGAK